MTRFRITIVSTAAAVALLPSLVAAQPAANAPAARPTPAAVPPVPAAADANAARPTSELESAAMEAFEANDYAKALPLLKDLAVRLRNSPDKVAPILEKIRVCEANVAPQVQQIEGINTPRTAHVKPTDKNPLALTLMKLGNFAYDAEKGGNIPADVSALSGAPVKLTGYMIPIDESDKITKFVLVPDLFGCCFGQPPQVQHTAIVVCPPGKAVSYFPDEISVTGTLKVEERRDEGFITSIFELTADSIKPTAK